MLANRDILEPVVDQTNSLVHEEEFTHLVKEFGFLKETCDGGKADNPSPPKVNHQAQTCFFSLEVSYV